MAQPLLVTVRLSGEATTDLVVDSKPSATIGSIAANLADAVEIETPRRPTIVIRNEQHVLDPDQRMGDAPIRSGDQIEVVSADQAPVVDTPPAAVLEVIEGPLMGLALPVAKGQWTLGRSSKTDIVLPEPSISARHLRVTIADEIVIEDLASTNGTQINDGEPITAPSTVSLVDTVSLGTTRFRFKRRAAGTGGIEPYVRSPRGIPASEATEFKVETPPRPAPRRRIPIATALVPVVAAVFRSVTTGDWANMLLALLGPLFYVGGRYIESRWITRATFRDQTEAWRQAFGNVVDALDRAQSAERARLEMLYPEIGVLTTKAAARDPILWSRNPAHDDFLSLRLGSGEVESIHSLTIPEGQSDATLMAEAIEAKQQRVALDSAPVMLPMDALGVVGLTERGFLEGAIERRSSPQTRTARSLILQAALLHSPTELQIFVLLPTNNLDQWDWLKWLPHVRAGSSLRITTGAESPALIAGLSTAIQDRLDASSSGGSEAKPMPRVLLVVADEESVSRPRVAPILRQGPQVGVYTCWVGTTRRLLPDGCQAIVEHTSDGFGSLEFLASGTKLEPIALDGVGRRRAVEVARNLAPLVDVAAVERGAELPTTVRFHELTTESILDEPDGALDRWSQSKTLRAPVGVAQDGPFHLDLRFDGPHGLVAGTTGAGKSEFLQSLIASLALLHPPSRINFLLVDYKGGAAFREAAELPHTVGFVTDLDDHLVQRSLIALRAELTRREELLNLARAKDLSAMEAAQHPETPPSLLIVVDEFAALAGEIPEFVDGIVDIAQRGRSLGLHLLLATQRPAGVVTNYIRANTNLRIALRVASKEESVDVIGKGDAAEIPRSIPGRAMARIGPTELIPFQSVFVGGRDRMNQEAPESIAIAHLRVSGIEPLVTPPSESTEEGPTDLQRILTTLKSAHGKSGRPDPRRPWLPPLEPLYSLESFGLSESASHLSIGLSDLPEKQTQQPAIVDFTAGHMLVLGASRAGKTVVLRSVIAALQMQTAEPVWVYGLDSAGGGLRIAEKLPSVGGIVQADEHERMTRLIRTVRTIIDDRRQRMGAAGAQDLAELRKLTSRNEPRVVVLLDGLHAFLADYETVERGTWVDQLAALMADGLATGVHFVVASDRRSGISTRMSSQLPQLLCLRLANDDDYLALGLRRGSLTAESPPGRGFLNGREVQVAILGGSDRGEAQAEAFDELHRSTSGTEMSSPPAIGVLPSAVRLSEIPADENAPVIGIRDSDLMPARLNIAGGLMGIFGRRASGRTTALLTVSDALRRWDGRHRTLLLMRGQPPKPAFGSWTSTASNPDEVADLIGELADRADETTRFAVFLDDYTDHLDSPLDTALAKLIPVTRVAPVFVVVSGDVDAARSSYGSEVMMAVKRSKTGLLLMPDSMDGDTLGANLPRTASRFVPGRGYNVTGGSIELIQVAVNG